MSSTTAGDDSCVTVAAERQRRSGAREAALVEVGRRSAGTGPALRRVAEDLGCQEPIYAERGYSDARARCAAPAPGMSARRCWPRMVSSRHCGRIRPTSAGAASLSDRTATSARNWTRLRGLCAFADVHVQTRPWASQASEIAVWSCASWPPCGSSSNSAIAALDSRVLRCP